jgi:hypothetical protein
LPLTDSSAGLRIKKYSLLGQVYFFLNSVFLPKGLLVTHLLAPYFYLNLIRRRLRTAFFPFFATLLLYDVIHLIVGVDLKSFFISNLLFVLTYMSAIAAYHFFNRYDSLGRLFKEILVVNFILSLAAIPFFFADPPYHEWFWYVNHLTQGIREFPRLAMFTYEASYYSLMFVPIAFYYMLKFAFGQIAYNKWLTMLMVIFPLAMSLSFGVLGILLLTILVLCVLNAGKLVLKKRALLIISGSLLLFIISLLVLWIYFPVNPLFVRVQNVLAGKDTSANGRTIDSFRMAWMIAEKKSFWFGSGLGQIKFLVVEIVKDHFNYWGNFARYDIPNAIGEAFAIFGMTGVLLKIGLEWWLFFRTKVYLNYYRLGLFIFVFIYQFTGSFITNIVEYVIWALAFASVFPQFSKPAATNSRRP